MPSQITRVRSTRRERYAPGMTDLLTRARRDGAPLIDGDRATFVWHGRTAPRLIGDFTDWEEGPLALQRAGPDLWIRTIEFHRDAYVEYAYVEGARRVRDAFNPRAEPNGIGSTNHYFHMPGASPTSLSRARRDCPRGRVTRHQVRIEPFGATATRRVHLYEPSARGPWPLLVVLDGDDYLRIARLPTMVDNLIAEHRIRPLAMAFVSHGEQARVLEYACNDATIGLITERLLPFARERLDLATSAGAHAILGASMGGLMALYAGLRLPRVFGRVLSQSGAFSIFGVDMVVFELVRRLPRRRLRIWMDVGHLERLRTANRRMRSALARRGYPVTYREYHAGHNYPAWRDDVWRGLEELFPLTARGRSGGRRARAPARAGRAGRA